MPLHQRQPRRPAGWVAPGPQPRGAQGRSDLEPAADEDLSYLTGDWRLFQKRAGHRWSLDDLVTAHVAAAHAHEVGARRLLDLGCGLGSVLLMMAWRCPDADVTGIEAQADRAALGRRSIDFNGVEHRCRIITGDMRTTETGDARFDLITGTPPYFPRGEGTESEKPHAAPCRFELRGGVETYLDAAAQRLAPHGRFVMCAAALARERIRAAFPSLGLELVEHVEVIPKEGKAALITVDVFSRDARPALHRTLTVRDRDDQWTPDFRRIRADMGMPASAPK